MFSLHPSPRGPLALALLASLTLPRAQEGAAAPPAPAAEQVVSLPEGPNSRAWAGVGPETVAVDLQRDVLAQTPWLRVGAEHDDSAAAWRGWGELLTAEAARAESAPRARATLALFACRQSRWQDAWAHLERLGGFPEWSAAVLPTLLPGAPLDTPPGLGGLAGALPDGVLLTPAVPPATDPPVGGGYVARSAALHGLRIGEATVDFKITLDGAGIQVDLLHTGGGAATVRVLLPEPEGLEIRVEYIDWMRQDERREPLLVELLPGEEEHNLFGRFLPRRVPLPASPRTRLPRALELGGLWLQLPAGGWQSAAARDGALSGELHVAAEVMAGVLAVPGGLLAADAEGTRPPGPWSSTVVHLPSDAHAARRFLAQIASRLESWVLRAPQGR